MCADDDQSRVTDLDDFGLGLRKLEKPDHLVHADAMRIAQERVRNSRPEAFGPLMEAVGKFRDEMDKPKN